MSHGLIGVPRSLRMFQRERRPNKPASAGGFRQHLESNPPPTAFLTSADDIARMDKRIGAKDFGAAMRAAKRLGSGRVAIVKACEAAEANSKKAKALLGEVPEELRGDLAYVLCRLHWLQVHDDFAEAAEFLTETSRVGLERQDTDEWWPARRLLP